MLDFFNLKTKYRSLSLHIFLFTNNNYFRANYLFVAGHYPIYSVSEHGSFKCLESKLDPLLRKYNVNAYLSGHDHNLQVISLCI